MAWTYLFLAGLFEIGWPIGLKIAQDENRKILGFGIAIFFMTVSGFLLYTAQKSIPIGTAYAIWTAIGAAGTFLVGVFVFGDPSSLVRYVGIALIILGVILLKIGN